MPELIELSASGNDALILRSDDGFWAQCLFRHGRVEHPLGNESMDSLVEKLQGWLEGVIERQEDEWVLSLCEPHGAMFASVQESSVHFKFQDKYGTFIDTLIVPLELLPRWKAILVHKRAGCVPSEGELGIH